MRLNSPAAVAAYQRLIREHGSLDGILKAGRRRPDGTVEIALPPQPKPLKD